MANLMSRVKRKLKEVYYGNRAYTPDHVRPNMVAYHKPTKKSETQTVTQTRKPTARENTITGGLKQAGLTEAEIAKFRSKK